MQRFFGQGARARVSTFLQPTCKYSCSTPTSLSKQISASAASTYISTYSPYLQRHIPTSGSGFSFTQTAHLQHAHTHVGTVRWLSSRTDTHLEGGSKDETKDENEDKTDEETEDDTEAANVDESEPDVIVDNFDGERVILIDGSNSKKIGEVSMGYAENFCYERGLKLKHVSKGMIPIYKTMSSAEDLANKLHELDLQRQHQALVAENSRKKNRFREKADKDTKEIKLSESTSEHDIRIKTKKGCRFLAKGLKVQINVGPKRRRFPQLQLQKSIMQRTIDIFQQDFPGGVVVGEQSHRAFDNRISQTITANLSK